MSLPRGIRMYHSIGCARCRFREQECDERTTRDSATRFFCGGRPEIARAGQFGRSTTFRTTVMKFVRRRFRMRIEARFVAGALVALAIALGGCSTQSNDREQPGAGS